MTSWRADELGDGFERLDLDLGHDLEGPLGAVLVRSLSRRRRAGWRPRIASMFHGKRPLASVDVLYVHGWSDYFFQRELAEFWTSRGARFFALDLRKYGRALRPGQTAGYIEDLDDYDREIEMALTEIAGSGSGSRRRGEAAAAGASAAGRSGGRRLLLLGHSTGGLILSLWAARHPGRADALVLNSPWLEFQLASTGRQLITPLVRIGARIAPLEATPQLDYGFYSRAQREAGRPGEYDGVDRARRPEQSHPMTSGWLRAVFAGHARVAAGLGLDVPVQVLLSARSALPLRWSDELTRADTVINVDEAAKAALRLGHSVTVERIDGALHDVFISANSARADAYARLDRWITGVAANWAK